MFTIKICPFPSSYNLKTATYEFHVLRKSRDLYRFDESLFSIRGDIVFVNFHGAHLFVNRINTEKRLAGKTDQSVQASQIYAAGLIDEVIHFVIDQYRRQRAPGIFKELFAHLEKRFGSKKFQELLLVFAEQFPSSTVYRDGVKAADYLDGESEGLANTKIVMEELIVCWLGNLNPAYSPVHELIDDCDLEKQTIYSEALKEVQAFFALQPSFGPAGSASLIDMLRAPALKSPDSLTGQLEYIRKNWGVVPGDLVDRILKVIDFVKEEEKVRYDGPGISSVPEFAGLGYDDEPERFSADLHWMPNLMLMAKCTYVWLDQLSKQYKRDIYRLDHIPDEELDRLASWGFTGLWLIGLWERSRASKRIKQLCGNPEAVASAYSLHDYDIAADLGGEEAYSNLRDRAWQRGIRLASDMVPNHMSIDSRWMVEHPDWFVQMDYPPFPSYSFNGTDLSDDDRVGVFIEDGYWNKTDAAVVFKRLDRHTGDIKYVYHGNDGTQMPWNDTAQLNYLNGEVREAVIQTILHVARQFPIIRFDAAMTLAKKHYQRLWFPQPGTGGDIPSRAEHAMTKEAFDQCFPVEFWREVVDRIHEEAPDTLLMAEAFWMMEGYFVRTLGMHRVYNSAFMNMLKDEDNGKYRHYIKNVLEFNPQIMKRYVNFMNNPDEDTAVEQFGKDDKYFGVAIMMCTMPGLPMFGHGQVEGYAEKYGMEYRRAYWKEEADRGLIERHEREVFPLLKKRHLYSAVDHFLLYDFFDGSGSINENVFAYSNGMGQERSLVLYNNSYGSTSGWIKQSASFNEGGAMLQHDLAYGLNISTESRSSLSIFKDQISGLEYIRPNSDILDNGFFSELGGFKYHVFIDFRQLESSEERPYDRLAGFLNGRGVLSIEEAMMELLLRPIADPFWEAVNPGSLHYLLGDAGEAERKKAFCEKLMRLAEGVSSYERCELQSEIITEQAESSFDAFCRFASAVLAAGEKRSSKDSLNAYLLHSPLQEESALPFLLIFLFVETITKFKDGPSFNPVAKWRIEKSIACALIETGTEELRAKELARLLKLFMSDENRAALDGGTKLADLLKLPEAQSLIGVNRHEEKLWFNKERLESLLAWLFALSAILRLIETPEKEVLDEKLHDAVETAELAAAEAAYDLEKFICLLKEKSKDVC
ncbi:MAG: alpha-amylase [Proteobacteria bacterium]|nr:alpha-amylase [Pseudomonadota bacterium]